MSSSRFDAPRASKIHTRRASSESPARLRESLADAHANARAIAQVAESVARASHAADAASAALEAVRSSFGWAYAIHWTMDASERALRVATDAGTIGEEHRRAAANARVREGEGLSGRAWRHRDLAFIEDVGDLRDCGRAPAAKRTGVKSGASFPIVVNDEVVGAMEFVALEHLNPSPERLDALRDAGRLVSLAIERLGGNAEAARIRSMMESAPLNVMFVDRELKVSYVNAAFSQSLRRLAPHLGARAAQPLGQDVGGLHEALQHRRAVLSDPKQLPHRASLAIGPESVHLLASAIHDDAGAFVGAMITWEIVTEKLAVERLAMELNEREKAQAEELERKVDLMLAVVDAAAKGDLTREVAVRGEDAVGQMGEHLAKFLGDLRASVSAIGKHAQTLGAAAEEMTAVSQQLGATAEQTAAQANIVSATSEEVSKNVGTVATGSEEMNASIKEISKNASEAARVATQAVAVADATNRTVAKLGESSAEIGKILKVITSIAQQTNLLALNATIEAARAGDAGKGFAVVANEVKELAKETAKATEDIGRKIDAIQSDTRGAVDAISQISEIVHQINDIQSSIATAVEEQTATTNEIGRNVGDAAVGTGEIAKNITGVAQAAHSTSVAAADTQTASAELARMASELQRLVGRFRY